MSFGVLRQPPNYYTHEGQSIDAATHLETMTDEMKAERNWLNQLIGAAAPIQTTTPTSTPTPSSTSAPTPRPSLPLVRLTLHDGRQYSGHVACVDSHANIVLANAQQVANEIDGIPVGGFALAQTLIAWKLVKKMEQLITPPTTTTTK